jgi:hypothetical protein
MPSRVGNEPAPSSCSTFSARLGEPLPGTAPVAPTWLAVEQPGAWGARALIRSRLDPALGPELARRAEGSGVRIALIRRVGRHALGGEAARTVLVCDTRPGTTALRSLSVTDPRELLDLDFTALGAGRIDVGEPHPGPALLVCTNGRRDRCCAQSGRALALDLVDAGAGVRPAVWETDHLGGHRFAPTAVVLPTGYVYGRLDARNALAALDGAARGQVVTEGSRGRSTWSRPGQAADLALRAELREYRGDAVRVLAEQQSGGGRSSVDLAAGNAIYSVLLEAKAAAEPRPESCGKPFGNPLELRVLSVSERSAAVSAPFD